MTVTDEDRTRAGRALRHQLTQEDVERVAAALAEERRRAQVEVLRAAAAEQRAEATQVPDTDEGSHADGHRCAAEFLDRRAAQIERLA